MAGWLSYAVVYILVSGVILAVEHFLQLDRRYPGRGHGRVGRRGLVPRHAHRTTARACNRFTLHVIERNENRRTDSGHPPEDKPQWTRVVGPKPARATV